MNKLLSLFILLGYATLQAQDINMIQTKYRMKLFEEKKLKPINTVKIEIEVTTPEGKLPGHIWIQDNFIYKIEVVAKEGKSYQLVDPTGYYSYSPKMKISQKHETSSEDYIKKKFLLNFYPFLNLKMQGDDYNLEHQGSEILNETPSIVYMQKYHGAELANKYFFDMTNTHVFKIVQTIGSEMHMIDPVMAEAKATAPNDVQKNSTTYYFKKYVKSPQGYFYPSEFTTPFGEATVKSIQFNIGLNQAELRPDFYQP